jgi:hypothetical protein
MHVLQLRRGIIRSLLRTTSASSITLSRTGKRRNAGMLSLYFVEIDLRVRRTETRLTAGS